MRSWLRRVNHDRRGWWCEDDKVRPEDQEVEDEKTRVTFREEMKQALGNQEFFFPDDRTITTKVIKSLISTELHGVWGCRLIV